MLLTALDPHNHDLDCLQKWTISKMMPTPIRSLCWIAQTRAGPSILQGEGFDDSRTLPGGQREAAACPLRAGEIVERYEEKAHVLVSRRDIERNWQGLWRQWFHRYAWPVTNNLRLPLVRKRYGDHVFGFRSRDLAEYRSDRQQRDSSAPRPWSSGCLARPESRSSNGTRARQASTSKHVVSPPAVRQDQLHPAGAAVVALVCHPGATKAGEEMRCWLEVLPATRQGQ